MECKSGSIQKDTADITGALTVQINSGSYVNGIHIQLFYCYLYINITHVFDKNQEHTCGFLSFYRSNYCKSQRKILYFEPRTAFIRIDADSAVIFFDD